MRTRHYFNEGWKAHDFAARMAKAGWATITGHERGFQWYVEVYTP